jgi:hypothetical protein
MNLRDKGPEPVEKAHAYDAEFAGNGHFCGANTSVVAQFKVRTEFLPSAHCKSICK